MFASAWTLAAVLSLQSAPAAPVSQAAPGDPAAGWTDDRPFTRLLPNLGRDLMALPSADAAWVMAAGAGATLAFRPVDDEVAEWAIERGESAYTAIGRGFGDGWFQSGLAVLTYGLGRVSGDARFTHVGSDLIRAQVLNAVTTRITKAAVSRERPNGTSSHSFPSGHASATFASASVLHAHFGWKAGVPAYAVASFVGWSRVRDHSHWVSDVTMGAAMGIVAGRAVTIPHRDRVWRVVPGRPPGGGFAIYVIGQPR